jgi:hypothetical protein
MRVEVDAAEVDHPGERSGVADHDLLGGGAGGVLQGDRVDPVGPLLRRPLLEERLLVEPFDEPLEDHRAAGDPAQRAVGYGQVVGDQVELGQAELDEHHLVGVGDRHLAAGDVEDDRLGLGHALSLDRDRRP